MAQPGHPMCADALNALNVLQHRREQFYLSSQNLIEFWRTCTRPIDSNGLGLTVIQTDAELLRLENLFSILPDTAEIYTEWRRLVVAYSVMGVNVHDARLVAVMLVNGLTHILTFNTRDFTRYSEITAIHPIAIMPQH